LRSSKTVASRGSRSRNHAATRFVCFLLRRESRVSRRVRRAQRRDARFSNPCRFLAMIAIECISTSALGASFALFCREIILAALLIMCNAAENFLPIAFRILRTAQDFRQEKKFFKSLGAPGDKRIRRRVHPGGRIARGNSTGAVLCFFNF